MTFTDKLQQAVISSNSLLCVGLDPVPGKIPASLKDTYPDSNKQVFEFCSRVIQATRDHACAYKPNTAFFEAMGAEGWRLMDKIFDEIPSDKILIADAKRGDIGNTARAYKRAFFDNLKSDAITLNPLMGMDTVQPFLEDSSKAVFLLVMTSNEGAADFLQKKMEDGRSLGEHIASTIQKTQPQSRAHLGMVVGATQPDQIGQALKASPDSHLLIPGIGSQGGTIAGMTGVLENHSGIPLFNVSRSVIYAGSDQADWIDQVEAAARSFKEALEPITRRYV